MLVNNRWIRCAGTLTDKPISIQYRQDWQTAKETDAYPLCIQIAWNASQLDEATGFPALAEQHEILAFGELLQQHLEAKENAVIAMVITHSGVNQWVIYCQDLERFKHNLERIPAREEGYPIEVVADEDPSWSIFTQIAEAIAQPA